VPKAKDESMQPLVHIGYHKTGTTWLQQEVFSNSAAGFSQLGGAQRLIAVDTFGFKPRKVRRLMERRIGEVRNLGLTPVLSSERLSGAPHFGGYDSEIIADRLAAVFPNARIMVVIRQQTDMFLSIYKQHIRRGGAASLRQYLAPPRDGYWMPQFRFEYLEYHRLIARYQDLFGAANVLVLPYELLRARPGEFLAKVSGFVGLPPAEPRFLPLNVSLSALSLSLRRHANRYLILDPVNPAPPLEFPRSHEILERSCRVVDAIVPEHLLERHERRWRHRAAREVGTRFAHSNARTAALTGLDLRTFGYECE
jgi:hypothetical protein